MSDILDEAREWDRCYPGNTNIEMLVDDMAAEITALRAERDADRYELKRLREVLDWGQSERTAARAIARELGVSVDASDEPGADKHLDLVCRILGVLTTNISAERDALKARLAEAVERVQKMHKFTTNPAPTTMSDRKVLNWVHGQAASFIASVDGEKKIG